MALTFYTRDFFLITYADVSILLSVLLTINMPQDLWKVTELTQGFSVMCFFYRKRVLATTTLSYQCTLTRRMLCVPEVGLAGKAVAWEDEMGWPLIWNLMVWTVLFSVTQSTLFELVIARRYLLIWIWSVLWPWDLGTLVKEWPGKAKNNWKILMLTLGPELTLKIVLAIKLFLIYDYLLEISELSLKVGHLSFLWQRRDALSSAGWHWPVCMDFFILQHPTTAWCSWTGMVRLYHQPSGDWWVCGTKWLSGLKIAVFSEVCGKKNCFGMDE